MTRTHRLLFLAITGSLLLHALPFLPELISTPQKKSTAQPMQASLRPPPETPKAPVPQVPLILPEKPVKKAPAPPPKPASKPDKPPESGAKTWTQAVRQQLKQLQDKGQFYPEEARRQGIEGEALVLLIIDPSGNVVAARIEQSSGYRILDDAALSAVRSLRSLPADAPQQSLLPVRFRLR